MHDTINISSIITTKTSEYKFLNEDLFWSFKFGSSNPLTDGGIPRPLLIVVPSILIAATSVGASSRTLGFPGVPE